MVKCISCGAENEDSAKFCESCGSEMPQDKECPSCHSRVKLTAKFCAECGFNFNKQQFADKSGSMLSMGDKNVIAGDVFGGDNIKISGNATIVKNEDETKKVVQCHVCGRRVTIVESFVCTCCNKITCLSCFNGADKVCDDCSKQNITNDETIYINALHEFYSADNASPEASYKLYKLKEKIDLPSDKITELEASVKNDTLMKKYSLTLPLFNIPHDIDDEFAKDCYQQMQKLLEVPDLYLEALENLAEAGHMQSQYDLGKHYLSANDIKDNEELAKTWLEKAAKQGNVEAMYSLFQINHAKRHYGEAEIWLEKAATNGHIDAQYAWGIEIKGYRKDKGIEFLKMAAEQGHVDASYQLAEICYGEDAVKWYRKAAEQEHVEAALSLASAYFYGSFGVDQDWKEAVKWYRKSAEQGNPDAQYHLGECFCYGHGVDEDKEEAVKWYRKAAEQGYDHAQYELGKCYFYGRGIANDNTQAEYWFNKVLKQNPEISVKEYLDQINELREITVRAEQGNIQAQLQLAKHYCTVDFRNESEALVWLKKAIDQGYLLQDDDLNHLGIEQVIVLAEQGCAEASYFLGKCYQNGRRVNENVVEAIKWFCKTPQGIEQLNDFSVDELILAEQKFGYPEISATIGFKYRINAENNEALQWYSKAAEQYNAYALLSICDRFDCRYNEATISILHEYEKKSDIIALYCLAHYYLFQDNADEAERLWNMIDKDELEEISNHIYEMYGDWAPVFLLFFERKIKECKNRINNCTI
ncbi:MAG: SEL1-like repeat protein [Lentisphaeria bacterium]|nr:SEL1-like repeat protein [Lentisphaeria bacterium]